MKNKFLFFLLALILLSCKHTDTPPSVDYLEAEETSHYWIIVSAVIVDFGSQSLTDLGFCVNYPNNPNPPSYSDCDTIFYSHFNGNVVFRDTINGIDTDKDYLIRAFAKSSAGIGESKIIKIHTPSF
ncbi:MAG: hypothetical protein IKW93_07345 [Bacteroidales bacterium]|nr:hypothetical protein [Bacteroidales bacterium]